MSLATAQPYDRQFVQMGERSWNELSNQITASCAQTQQPVIQPQPSSQQTSLRKRQILSSEAHQAASQLALNYQSALQQY